MIFPVEKGGEENYYRMMSVKISMRISVVLPVPSSSYTWNLVAHLATSDHELRCKKL